MTRQETSCSVTCSPPWNFAADSADEPKAPAGASSSVALANRGSSTTTRSSTVVLLSVAGA
jgi:hypothetical protein